MHFNYYGKEMPETSEESSEIDVEINIIEPTPEINEFFDQLIKNKNEANEENPEESLENTVEKQVEDYNQPWLVKQQEAIYNSNKRNKG